MRMGMRVGVSSEIGPLTRFVQTQTAMEHWNIANVRAAIEEGKLKSPVPEQAGMQ